MKEVLCGHLLPFVRFPMFIVSVDGFAKFVVEGTEIGVN